MIRDITIGQYYPGDSWIHRLDPRVKIIITIMYIVQIFLAKDFLGFAAVVIALAVVIGISKVPVSFIFRGLKPIIIIILFTFIINMFMIDGKVLVKLGFLTITDEGLYTAFLMAVSLILL
ncbi:MAG: CbiQ family ECF transporter T component, partial [Bacillota bacterium]|nr:CbiQ family ECF transporter T component [Bacillota bacterium]